MKIKLTITVDYIPNGTPATDLINQLKVSAQYLANEQMLTGDTSAKVRIWDYKAEEITHVSIHTLDLKKPRHASAFMKEVGRHLSDWPQDKSAQEIHDLIKQESDDISPWHPFEDYSHDQILEFITEATISSLND